MRAGLEFNQIAHVIPDARAAIDSHFGGLTPYQIPSSAGIYSGTVNWNHHSTRCYLTSYDYGMGQAGGVHNPNGFQQRKCTVRVHYPGLRCPEREILFGRETLKLVMADEKFGTVRYEYDETVQLRCGRLAGFAELDWKLSHDASQWQLPGGPCVDHESTPVTRTEHHIPRSPRDLDGIIYRLGQMVGDCVRPWVDAGRPLRGTPGAAQLLSNGRT